jgi:hypothetical protein
MLPSPATFANAGIIYTPNAYGTAITVSATAYNCVNNSSAVSGSISAVMDPLSYNLLNNSSQYPSSIPTTTGTAGAGTAGMRITTGTTSGTTYVTALSGSATSITLYNQTANILSSEELQLVNGCYAAGSYPNAYTSIYSGVSKSGLRYTTFAWKCATNTSTNYSKIQFTINGISGSISNYTSALTASSGETIPVFYRIEDGAAPSEFNASNRNTTWLNAYGQGTYANLTGGNYFNTATQYSGQNTAISNTLSSGVLTMNVSTQSFQVAGGNSVYIYLRVGLPMNTNLGFSYVTAKLY